MLTEIENLIVELRAAYVKAGRDWGDGILPPATDAAIDEIGAQLGMMIPDELRDVLRVCGGQIFVSPGLAGLFGRHWLYSPSEIIEAHQMHSTYSLVGPPEEFPPQLGDWGYWIPELIPFAAWDSNYLCIHSIRGDIWEFHPGTGLVGSRPSITSYLKELVDLVKLGGKPELQGRHW
ncbi:hypothetical protein BH09VER1_BH09VER1_52830 [soil metagenome]